MAWYPLPRTGAAAGDEFFETQSAGWLLWNFAAPDDRSTTAGACSIRQEHGDARPCSKPGPSEEEPWVAHAADDNIFLSQLFSDEEMRRMDCAPLKTALDVFPDSVHTLLSSYENMFAGVLTGSEEGGDQAKQLDRDGVVDAMDTCGLQNGSGDAGQSAGIPDVLAEGPSSDGEEQAGLQSMTERSRAVAETEITPGFEAVVLEELEDVVFQLTSTTRIRYRDAFYRLAESSKANCSSRQMFQQLDGNAASWFSSTPGCPERETNPIDRTVMILTTKPPPPPHQLHGGCCAGEDSGAEAQAATSWTTRA